MVKAENDPDVLQVQHIRFPKQWQTCMSIQRTVKSEHPRLPDIQQVRCLD
jgi:hypothetical protein